MRYSVRKCGDVPVISDAGGTCGQVCVEYGGRLRAGVHKVHRAGGGA